MKLTTKGWYALRALIDLITNSNGKPVRLTDISVRQNLPVAYLEQLFRRLRMGGVVKSVRGPGGGYVLAKEASEISIHDVLKAVKELTSYADTVKLNEGSTAEAISAHQVITRLDTASMTVLMQPISSLL